MIKFLVTDLGVFTDHAVSLLDNGKNQVRYYTDWPKASPLYEEFVVGKDLDGLEKIDYFWDRRKKYLEWADCIVNFDVHNNDQIAFLRELYPDKSIFGSGKGEVIENDRNFLKKMIKKLSLPQQKYDLIRGTDNLREYLKTHPDVYVKMDIFRGNQESFYAKDYETVEKNMTLANLEFSLGPHRDSYEFTVEEALHAHCEIGFDGFFNGVDYVSPYIWGYEYNKGPYIAKVSKKLPKPIQETMDAFIPELENMDYRGAISTEEKIFSDKEHYVLDVCARQPYPCGLVYTLIKNWAEMVYKIGAGEFVEAQIPYEYLGAIPLESKAAEKKYVLIELEKKHRDEVKLLMATGHKGDYYAVKGQPIVAVLVAGGSSPDEVFKKLEIAAEHVDAEDLDKDVITITSKLKEVIKEGEEAGVEF